MGVGSSEDMAGSGGGGGGGVTAPGVTAVVLYCTTACMPSHVVVHVAVLFSTDSTSPAGTASNSAELFAEGASHAHIMTILSVYCRVPERGSCSVVVQLPGHRVPLEELGLKRISRMPALCAQKSGPRSVPREEHLLTMLSIQHSN